jgi:HEPN domain-containing protein
VKAGSSMPRDRLPPDDPREWLNRARSNLAQARVRHPEVYLEDLCWNAHQAAERAIKALLLSRCIRFPYVRDIGWLLLLLKEAGEDVPRRIEDAVRLNVYSVAVSYPGVAEPVAEEEHTEALALAEAVVRWAEERLAAGA